MLIVFLSTLQIIGMPVASEYLCQLVADHLWAYLPRLVNKDKKSNFLTIYTSL